MAGQKTVVGECGWFVKGIEATKPGDVEGRLLWDGSKYGELVVWPREKAGRLEWRSYGVPTNMSPWSSWATSVQAVRIAEGVSAQGSLRGFLAGCSQLVECDLGGLDAANVQDAGLFFSGCSGLRSVDLGFLSRAQIELADGMFKGCSFLAGVDCGKLDVSELVDATEMFSGCESIRAFSADWGLGRVKTVLGMFADCGALEELKLRNATFERCRNFACFLRGARNVRSVLLDSANPKAACDMWAMFSGCESLEEILVGQDWTIPEQARCVAMFDGTSCRPARQI